MNILVFIIGLFIGSFLNCVIYRLEEKKSFLKGRSFCPSCKHTLFWYDLIPVLSFIFLLAKCRYCKKKISWQYPIVELATGLVFLTVFYYFGISLFLLAICSFLIIIFVFDLKHFIIPDKVIYPLIVITFCYKLFGLIYYQYGFTWFLYTIFTAIFTSLFFLLIVLITKGKGMGLGDVKLAFFMGLFLGLEGVLVALFFAFSIGAIIGIGLIVAEKKKLKSEVPFGPFLTTGTLISLFWASVIIDFYFNIFI